MIQKKYNQEDILRLLREIEVYLHGGMDIVIACRTAGISDKTYYGWRKRYGYRKIAQLLQISGRMVNHKKVERIWREERLLLRERLKRKHRLYHKIAPSSVCVPMGLTMCGPSILCMTS